MKIEIRESNLLEREEIYRMRHSVYAHELGQHLENEQRVLKDTLDNFNTYLVATRHGNILGFVSITPPQAPNYSIEKYIARSDLPFEIDNKTHEIRLLTVRYGHRGGKIAALLVYASLKWVEARGGTRLICMGRTELLDLYHKFGMQEVGIKVNSGALTFDIMTETIDRAREFENKNITIVEKIIKEVNMNIEPSDMAVAYHGGAFFNAIGDDFQSLYKSRDIINADVLDAWYPPSPKVLASIRDYLPWLIRTSPPTQCEGMVRTIAKVRNVHESNILPGAGSSDLIYRSFTLWLDAHSRVLVIDPTYGEYTHVLEKVIGCTVDRIVLSADNSFSFVPGRLKEYLDNMYDLIVIVNPNNPTGMHTQRADLQEILKQVPNQTRVWIDEAYVEYAGEDQSLEQFATQSENIVVCKSMSKVYALSGIRVGYLCASPMQLDHLRSLTPPWIVSLPGQVAAVMALQDPEYYQMRYSETHELRHNLANAIKNTTNVYVHEGVANYLLCQLAADDIDASTLVRECRAHGLFLRDMSLTSPILGPKSFRIAVKDSETNKRMVRILNTVLD